MAQKPILATSADLEASLLAGAAVLVMPTGVVLPFAGNSSPSGWLACNGAAVSRTLYSSLFTVLGTAFGVGDGSTTFNLPDLRGRFPRFNDAMFGGTAAGRDSGRVHGSAQADATNRKGLTVTNNAVTSGAGSSHSHSPPAGGSNNYLVGYASGGPWNMPTTGGGLSAGPAQPTGAEGAHTHSITSNVALNAGDAETRPINLSVNAIIKI